MKKGKKMSAPQKDAMKKKKLGKAAEKMFSNYR